MNVETVELQSRRIEVAKTDEAVEVLSLSLDDLDLVAGGSVARRSLLGPESQGETGARKPPTAPRAWRAGTQHRPDSISAVVTRRRRAPFFCQSHPGDR